MLEFLEEKINIAFDGSWNVTEVVISVIVVLVLVLLIVIFIKIIGAISRKMNPRKDTIFSHRKNKYKNRIGKKAKY